MRYLLSTVFFLFVFFHLMGQQANIVINQGITSDLHRNAIGEIRFSSSPVANENFKEADFLKKSELTNKTSLFMHAFMDNSITNYIHFLSPDLSLNEIHENGNFQFTFFVDDVQVYQENLHPGAGLPPRKDNETILSRPLVSYPNPVGWWSEFMWNRFKNNGGDKALTEGKHLFRLEIRPYVTIPALKVGNLIAKGEIELDVKKPKIDISNIRLNEVKPYDGFDVSKESYDTGKIKHLKGNIEEAVFRNITSVVVIKNGEILIEEYFNNADRNTLHDVRSVGKSFASTVTGIAVGEGFLENENQTLREFYDIKLYDNYSPEKENVSLRDLLTMASVFEGNDGDEESAGNEEKMYPTDDWVEFTLNLPVIVAKKSEWKYFTAGVVLLGDVLDKNVPGGLEKYADTKLFKPLGIAHYKWQYTPQKVANTAGGIQMNALDFAKYGQLYKNGGKWNEKQIIPEEWVNKTFTKHEVIPGRNDEYYGYLFWNKKYKVNGQDYETFYCTGNGGNKIFVFKDQPLVVVVTATAFNTSYGHSQVDEMMEGYILPAVLQRKQN